MNDDHYDEIDFDEPTVESAGPPVFASETTSDDRVGFVLGCTVPGCSCHIAHASADRLHECAQFLRRTSALLEARDAESARMSVHQ